MKCRQHNLFGFWLFLIMGKAASKREMRHINSISLLEKSICDTLEHHSALRDSFQADRGLSHIDAETLQKALKPLEHELRDIDAERFLKLSRAFQGPAIAEGVSVKAIHDEILPREEEGAVRYLKLAETKHYSIGVFIFPPNIRMPIHDHPGMVVYSRILYGELQRVRLDLNPMDEMASADGGREAFLHPPDHLQAPDVTALFPFQGNLHEFQSGPDGAAVLDVLVPPYNDDDRDCTYYEIHGGPGLCRVVPCEADDSFNCLNGTYAKWNC